MHCGWMDERDWTGPGCVGKTMAAKPSVGFAGVEWTEDVCPGWAVRQPAIAEICEAYMAFDAGALGELFPGVSNSVAEGLFEFKRALSEYERMTVNAMKEENAGGGR